MNTGEEYRLASPCRLRARRSGAQGGMVALRRSAFPAARFCVPTRRPRELRCLHLLPYTVGGGGGSSPFVVGGGGVFFAFCSGRLTCEGTAHAALICIP